MRTVFRALAALAGLLAALYLLACAGLFLLQRQILFRPEPLDLPPATLGLPDAAVHTLVTADGARLVAWLVPGAGPHLILYLHGTGGSLVRRAGRVRQLAASGSVLAIDYRGFGGSTGEPSEAGLTRDAEAAYRFAVDAGFAPADIVVVGESLGSGLALRLAARRPVGGVVLAAAYPSIRALAAERYPMFPVRWLLRDPFDVADEVGRVRAPILLLHGTEDRVIPIRYAERLAAGAGPNLRLVPVAGAPHLVLGDPEAARDLAAWIARLPGSSREAAAPPR